MNRWLVPRTELTPDQLRAVELAPTQHRVVAGAPGTGKTLVLVHRARHLLDTGFGNLGRCHIFVFTNVLKEYIRSALDFVDLPDGCVSTFDSWCTNFYKRHIGGRLPWRAAPPGPDFEAIREAVFAHCRQHAAAGALFDFVLVDEGQDLEPEVHQLLSTLARHVTVCLDHKQQIYSTGSDREGILSALGVKRETVMFLDAFRCSPYVVDLAAHFIANSTERDAFLQQTRMPQRERERPLLYCGVNFEDEKRHLLEVLRARLNLDKSIAILLPEKRQVFGFAQGLSEAGVEVEAPRQTGKKSRFREHDFSSNRPKLMPYHSAKGLTFETVLLPRLTAAAFKQSGPVATERLLFVGITRATKWVYVSTVGAPTLLGEDRVRSLQAGGILDVRWGSTSPPPPRSTPPKSGPAKPNPLDVL